MVSSYMIQSSLKIDDFSVGFQTAILAAIPSVMKLLQIDGNTSGLVGGAQVIYFLEEDGKSISLSPPCFLVF